MAKFTEADLDAGCRGDSSRDEYRGICRLSKSVDHHAKDPRFHHLYTDLVYQPMLEVMRYLRERGFRTYIVTGGGQEFVRVYSGRISGHQLGLIIYRT